jgi:hypothetical protein
LHRNNFKNLFHHAPYLLRFLHLINLFCRGDVFCRDALLAHD